MRRTRKQLLTPAVAKERNWKFPIRKYLQSQVDLYEMLEHDNFNGNVSQCHIWIWKLWSLRSLDLEFCKLAYSSCSTQQKPSANSWSTSAEARLIPVTLFSLVDETGVMCSCQTGGCGTWWMSSYTSTRAFSSFGGGWACGAQKSSSCWGSATTSGTPPPSSTTSSTWSTSPASSPSSLPQVRPPSITLSLGCSCLLSSFNFKDFLHHWLAKLGVNQEVPSLTFIAQWQHVVC